ncbi:hypothetical protein Tco_1434617 [Tanacetum coccineum]
MDSVIPLRQKNTLAEYMILSGADNRPPMLDKDLYDSWKSRMELYMQNREHGRMILESVENVQEVAAPRAIVLADSPVSTSINQDAPSSSTLSTQEQEQTLIISQGFEESPKTPIFHNDPLNESPHEESTP